MPRTVFFVSDSTGITAETLGRALLAQFEAIEYRQQSYVFIDSEAKVATVIEAINHAARQEGGRPLVFSTLADHRLLERLKESAGMILDPFDAFLGPLARELERLTEDPPDLIFMAAAVSDYRFEHVYKRKIKKATGKIDITLVPTVDILSKVAGDKKNRAVVAFAAETDNIVENAKAKLLKKKADIVIANVIGKEGVGFASANAEAVIITEERVTELGKVSKIELAAVILDELAKIFPAAC